jgi:hypothetical protein
MEHENLEAPQPNNLESAEGFQCLRCGGVYNGQGHVDLCPQCRPPPVDNLHVAEGCEQFSSAPDGGADHG